ncbi:MAG: type II secretion system protein [Nitrospirae bacterium]|nr:type II secretion system protein [Nitrospirota bacterium]
MANKSCNKGFTILELIISITLMGIIVVILMGAMRLGLRSIESGEKKTEQLERMRSSINIIDYQIQSQFPLTYTDEDGNKSYYFQAGQDFMQFATNYSIWNGGKGYVIATYKVIPEDNKEALYVSENIIGIDEIRDTKLFDNYEKIYFEYFTRDLLTEEGKWVNEWTNEMSFPEKVKIHLIKDMNDFSMIFPIRTRGTILETSLGFEEFEEYSDED